MKSYLSIDLDYWCDHKTAQSATRFFNRVFSLGKPITIVAEHDDLLPDVNRMKGDILYNFDSHEDYCVPNAKAGRPCDGDWVSWVKWRHNARYVWAYPATSTWQYSYKNVWSRHDWREIRGMCGGYSQIQWHAVKRVGVCISPLYTTLRTVKPVLERMGLYDEARALFAKTRYHYRRHGVLKRLPGRT